MYQKNYVVFTIDSAKVTCLCAKKDKNKNGFTIIRKNERYYKNANEWIMESNGDVLIGSEDIVKINESISNILAFIKNTIDINTKYCVVSIPNNSCYVETRKTKRELNSTKKVKQKDIIDSIKCDNLNTKDGYVNIFNSCINYSLKEKLNQPRILESYISCCNCNKELIERLSETIYKNKLKPLFVFGEVIELNTLIKKSNRDLPYIVFSLEDNVSSIILGRENGIEKLKNIKIGINTIIQKLMDKFSVDENVANILLKYSFIGKHRDENTQYSIENRLYKIGEVNDVVKETVLLILEEINVFLKYDKDFEVKPIALIYLTGQLSRIDGIEEYINDVVSNVSFKILSREDKFNEIEYNIATSVLEFATKIY